MKEALNNLVNIISERRTIKPDQYSGAVLDDSLIQKILEQANWAPTHGYTEPWRFVVYKGAALERLGEFLANFNQGDPEAPDFNKIRYNRIKSRPSMASHVIGVAMLPGTNPKIPEIEEVSAVAMAVQNMWLTCHAMGLGAYWSTGKAAFSDEFCEFMGFDKQYKSLGLFYIGATEKNNPPGRRISNIDTKVRWES